MGLKERYTFTRRRYLGASRELFVETALKLLGFMVERVGLGVCDDGLIKGWSGPEDAFDFKVSRPAGPRIHTVYVEVTGCSLTPQESRRRLWRLLRLDRPAVLVQRSKLEKYERYAEHGRDPVALAHVWDPLLRIDWAWMEDVKAHVLGEFKLKSEPTPYLVVGLDIWKPLSRLPAEIARPPAARLADLIPRKRR